MQENIKKVGLPQWSEDDQTLAKALQKELKVPSARTADECVQPLRGRDLPIGRTRRRLRRHRRHLLERADHHAALSRQHPGVPGHNWANAIAMATPIAHKGVIAGAKVQAMTMLDILMHPELVKNAWDYFRNVQTKDDEVQAPLRVRTTSPPSG